MAKSLKIRDSNGWSLIINDRYILGKKLGHGSFGEVYFGIDKAKNSKGYNQSVAIKLEKITEKTSLNEHEKEILTF